LHANILSYVLYAGVVIPALVFTVYTKDHFVVKETAWTALALAAIGLWLWRARGGISAAWWRRVRPVAAAGALYLAGIFLSGINAAHWQLVCETAVLHSFYLLFALLVAGLDPAQVRRLWVWAAVGCCATCVYGLMQYAGVDPIPWRGFGSRPGSTLGNPNFFAGYLVVCLPVCAGMALSAARWQARLLWLAISGLCMANIIVSRTRGAWIACGVSMLLMALLIGRRHHRLGLAAGLALLLVASGGFLARDPIRTQFNGATDSVVERVFKWKTAREIIRDHPLLGVGAGNLKVQYAVYQQRIRQEAGFALRGTSESNVHNEFLQIAAEQGGIGLVLFLLVWAVYARRFWPARDDAMMIGYAGAVSAFLVFSLSNFPLRILPTGIAVFAAYGATFAARSAEECDAQEKYYIMNTGTARLLVAFVFILGSGAALFGWALPRLRAEVCRGRGDDAVRQGRPAQAVLQYERAIALDYAHAERTAYDLGEVYRAQGDIARALRAYEISVDLRNYGEVYHDIGNCAYLLGNSTRALDAWRQAQAMGLPDPRDQLNLEKNIRILEQQAR